MSLFHDSALVGSSGQSTGYQISRSLRFNSSDSAYLSRTPASAGNRKTWTWSGWVKRSAIGTNQWLFAARGAASPYFLFGFNQGTDNNVLRVLGDTTTPTDLRTTQVFRDASAWFHLVVAVDTTQATASNRIKIYVNGDQVTSFSQSDYPGQNNDTNVNATVIHHVSGQNAYGEYFNGYLADIHFIDGQALTPSSFAETNAITGQWVPKAYSGTYGTNGFQLKFADNSNNTAATLGKDTSGNGNNWTPNNLSVTAGAGNDSLVDTPTSYGTDTGAGGEVRGNYATLNPLSNSTGRYTLSDGNLKIAATDAFNAYVSGTIALPASGKFYFEYTCTNTSTSQLRDAVGFVQNNLAQTYLGNSGTLAYEGYVGTVVGVATGNYSTWGNNDVIGIAVDCSTGKVWFSKNNTWQNSGSPTGGTGQVATLTNITNWIPACGAYAGSQFNYTVNGYINFGQRPFAYTAPSGFKALCDTNLPAPVVAKPSTVMDVKLYTGNSSTQTISGLGFSPDFVWLKQRTNPEAHGLFDTVRGAQKSLASDGTGAENATDTNSLTAFTSDGFSLGNTSRFNDNTYAHVAWAWDAGSSTTTNNSGSISSQVRANASAGFSIVTYTGNGTVGATVGHGLGVAPALVIFKNRSTTTQWNVIAPGILGAGYWLALNSTSAVSFYDATWTTNSTNLVLSDGGGHNGSGNSIVAYCFAPVAGYSSFGSYTGNGSSDGPFVYTGFRPRWILLKRSSTTSNWVIFDTSRGSYNINTPELQANTSAAEASLTAVDILSNGFKSRTIDFPNNSATTFIYAAFAENPFQYARAR